MSTEETRHETNLARTFWEVEQEDALEAALYTSMLQKMTLALAPYHDRIAKIIRLSRIGVGGVEARAIKICPLWADQRLPADPHVWLMCDGNDSERLGFFVAHLSATRSVGAASGSQLDLTEHQPEDAVPVSEAWKLCRLGNLVGGFLTIVDELDRQRENRELVAGRTIDEADRFIQRLVDVAPQN